MSILINRSHSRSTACNPYSRLTCIQHHTQANTGWATFASAAVSSWHLGLTQFEMHLQAEQQGRAPSPCFVKVPKKEVRVKGCSRAADEGNRDQASWLKKPAVPSQPLKKNAMAQGSSSSSHTNPVDANSMTSSSYCHCCFITSKPCPLLSYPQASSQLPSCLPCLVLNSFRFC